ncbi:MAG: hypothetical protein F7B06_07725 [Opitutae bacterium]|nr:hypothetical protein [Opitutae bacterium]MBC9889725.1 hypothetical protein [Opitutae bacterium]
MKSILVRGLHEDTLARLKRRAARHHRSLQKEVQALLEDAAQMIPAEEVAEPKLKLHIVHSGRSDGNWSRETIYHDDGR